MDAHALAAQYRKTWLTLMGLAALSVLISYLPLGATALTLLIFSVALVKVGIVMARFMHFEAKQWLISGVIGSALFLLVAMVVLMWLDFVGVDSGPQMLGQ